MADEVNTLEAANDCTLLSVGYIHTPMACTVRFQAHVHVMGATVSPASSRRTREEEADGSHDHIATIWGWCKATLRPMMLSMTTSWDFFLHSVVFNAIGDAFRV